jgi:hypothetical protein
VQSFDARGTLLLGAPQGVFRSVDGGASWSRTNGVFRGISAGFTKGSTIVSRGRRFQRGDLSYDRVLPSQHLPFGGRSFVRALAWVPGGKLYAAVDEAPHALYVTLDSARTWYPLPAIGMPLDSLRGLAAGRAPNAPDVLYAAAAGQGLWRSIDGGVTFFRLHLPRAATGAVAVTAAPAHLGRVLVATPLVYWSDDYGAHWHATHLSARLLSPDPRNGDVFYAVSTDGLLRASSDGGRTW